MRPTTLRLAFLAAGVALSAAASLHPAADDAPVPVRQPEGVTHGFVVVTTLDGDTVAWGDQVETVEDGVVDARLVLHFTDGSLHDERARFTQDGVFRLVRYELTQRGPAFATRIEASLDGKTGAWQVRSRGKDDEEDEVKEGTLDLPKDVYSGMMPIIVKNLAGDAQVHVVAFTPGPQTVAVEMSAEPAAALHMGSDERPVGRWVLHPDLGFAKGLLASLVGRTPKDDRIWVAPGDAPAFLRFEGPLQVGGTSWRIDRTTPRWP